MRKGPGSKAAADKAKNADTPVCEDELREAQAENVRERSAAAFLYASLSKTVGESFGPDAFKAYRDQLLADSGNPHDPVEIMLVESVAVAFHNVGRLHVKSATADDHQVAATYAAAATKLTGEFRRLSLALAEYREKASTRLGVVHGESEDDSDAAKHVA